MEVSVIIAAKNGARSIRSMMDALLPQLDFIAMEVLVVDASTDGTGSIIESEYPQTILLKCSSNLLIPELWSKGLFQSRGKSVIIYAVHCVPAMDWVKNALHQLEDGCDGVGGAIELAPKAHAIERAIYFCRYARYMPPFPRHETWDLPGDCSAYRREALFRYVELFREGFWEPVINKRMLDEGCHLVLDPRLKVTLSSSFSLGAFILNRFNHGIKYGSGRAVSRSLSLALMLASVMLPVLLLFRSASLVLRKRAELGAVLLSMPYLFLFFVSWSTGEALGYARKIGAPDHSKRKPS